MANEQVKVMTKRLFCIVMVFIAAVSCSKDNTADEPVIEGHSLFYADVETLAFWSGNDYDHMWLEGESIGIYASEQGDNFEYTLKRAYYGATGDVEFYGPKVKGDVIMAYYPYDADIEAMLGRFPVSVTNVQTYDPDVYKQFLSMTGVFARYDMYDDGKLHFEYPLGCMAVTIDYPITVVSMTLECESRNLAGRGYIDENLNLEMSSTGARSIRLDCGEGVESTADDKKTFHIMLPPGTYPERDLTLTVEALPASDSFMLKMKALEVKRVSILDNDIVTVDIGGELPGFDIGTNPLD